MKKKRDRKKNAHTHTDPKSKAYLCTDITELLGKKEERRTTTAIKAMAYFYLHRNSVRYNYGSGVCLCECVCVATAHVHLALVVVSKCARARPLLFFLWESWTDGE